MNENKQFYGIFAALLANLIFGFSFIFSKIALTAAHPLIILSVRFTVAFVALNLLILSGKVKITLKNKPKIKLIMMAFAQPLLYFIFELYGLSLVSSALSGIIIALVPVVVMVLAVIFLNEKPSIPQIVCTVISIVGISVISIISNNNSKNYFLGVVLLLAAVICAAVFNILSRSESQTFSPFERTYMMFMVGCIGFNLIAVLSLRGKYLPLLTKAVCSPSFLISILYLSIVSSVIAFMLYNYSTTKISVVQSSSFSNIITVVSVIAGVVILKEKLTYIEYFLCAVIILGVWGVNTFTDKKISRK